MSDPIFTLASTNPFGLIDVGDSASPTLVDIDVDGDLDAFVGNQLGNTMFFRNIGTANSPVLAAASTNPFGLIDVGYLASLIFVDIDNDNDLDAFTGNQYGNTLFFRNTGTVTNPMFAAVSTNPFGLSNVNAFASPTLVDIDGDGDLDAIVGNNYGNALFFRNTGTTSDPVFASPITNPFGLSFSGNTLNRAVFVDIDSDGDLDELVGNGNLGSTWFFQNKGTAISPVFSATPITNPFGLIDVGSFANPTFADIDGDGDLDAFVGNFVGNTLFFANNGLLLVSTSGNDILAGTLSNNDTLTYAPANAAVNVSLVITTQQNTIGAGLDTLVNIEHLIGSNHNDSLIGDIKNNILDGGAGNDLLNGGAGIDTMIGGLGNDTFVVNHLSDLVTEKSGEGTDKVNSSVTYILPANVENLTLTSTLVINGTGNGQANKIIGNSANNQLNGGAGNDTLDGGAGTNILIGGAGKDIFKFITANHADTITDYDVTDDTIQLDNAIFTALTATGTVADGQFKVGAQAVDANDFIIYNSATGKLLYDIDGNGAGAMVQIATVGVGLAMTNADIVVI